MDYSEFTSLVQKVFSAKIPCSISESCECLGKCFIWENKSLPLRALRRWQMFKNLHSTFLVILSKALNYLVW